MVPLSRVALLAGTLVWGASCAKIGDPLPPLRTLPDAVIDLQLVQSPDRIRLVFRLPPWEVQAVEVYRACGAEPPAGMKELQRVARVDRTALRSAGTADDVFWEEERPLDEGMCSYSVRLVAPTGAVSGLSEAIRTSPLIPAAPPRDLTASLEEGEIVLRWLPPLENADGSRPPRIAGYLVNSTLFVRGVEYRQALAETQISYRFQVQTVTLADNPLVLSRPSPLLEFRPGEGAQLPAPEHVDAVSVDGKVQLFWDAVAQVELTGYRVYRGETPDNLVPLYSLQLLNHFVDADVESGNTYYYQVTAVGREGSEGPRSEMVSVQAQ